MFFLDASHVRYLFKSLKFYVQLNEYETDPYFLQFFQSNLIIHVFCKNCEPEIVFVLIFAEQF